jgi:2-methylcitrate dehydratase PrpD
MLAIDPAPRRASGFITEMSAYAADALGRSPPAEVVEKAAFHILDTLCAMLTGTDLAVGKKAHAYAATLGETGTASVVGTARRLHPADAALINGMLAHADETDDSHPAAIGHPGCAVVPAALAAAEANAASGRDFLRAVVLGYDYYARMNLALGARHIYDRGHGPYSIGGAWGAAAAAGALYRLPPERMTFVFSNVAQQTGGIATWMRDHDHTEKAFHFGGLPARNGVSAATMVAAGFSGTDDVIEGRGNFMDAYSDRPDRDVLVEDLGQRFEIMLTNIKKWCVGSPIQAALDSLQYLMETEGVSADNLASMLVELPTNVVDVVEDRGVPDINCRHCLALMLADGRFGFHASHDYARLADPRVLALKSRIRLAPSDMLAAAKPIRQAIVTATLADGRTLSRRTYAVRGVIENPMSRQDVVTKATDLLSMRLSPADASAFIDTILAIDSLPDIRALRGVLERPA